MRVTKSAELQLRIEKFSDTLAGSSYSFKNSSLEKSFNGLDLPIAFMLTLLPAIWHSLIR